MGCRSAGLSVLAFRCCVVSPGGLSRVPGCWAVSQPVPAAPLAIWVDASLPWQCHSALPVTPGTRAPRISGHPCHETVSTACHLSDTRILSRTPGPVVLRHNAHRHNAACNCATHSVVTVLACVLRAKEVVPACLVLPSQEPPPALQPRTLPTHHNRPPAATGAAAEQV